MPRLFVYFAEAQNKSEAEKNILQAQFKIMQRRLWYGITLPSSIVVFLMGGSLLSAYMPLSDHPWLIVKLCFVVGLYLYQYFLHRIFKQQQNSQIFYTPTHLRLINEVSTLFLVAIVFLVVVKDIMNMLYGLLGLFSLIILLMVAIKIYKNIRLKNGEKV